MKIRYSIIPLAGLMTAEFLSLVGNQMAAVAIPLLVLERTHSPLVTGIASTGNILPIVLAAFIGGKAIDRLGAWAVGLISDILSCFSVLALPLAFLYSDYTSPASIFLVVFAGALFDPTGIAARQTMIPRLAKLSGQSLSMVNSIRGSLENGADFLGPVLAAGLISLIGTIKIFYLNAASFLGCALIFIFTVPVKRGRSPGNRNGDLFPGIRFIFRNAHLRSITITGILVSFVIIPFLGLLLPVFTAQVLKRPALLGICLSAFGVGATLGAVSFSRLSGIFSRSAIYYGGIAVTGLAMVMTGINTSEPSVALSIFIAGAFLGAGNPLEQTILHEESSQIIAGQIFTSHAAVRFAAGPLGLLLAGMVMETTEVRTVLLIAGGTLSFFSILSWMASPLKKAGG